MDAGVGSAAASAVPSRPAPTIATRRASVVPAGSLECESESMSVQSSVRYRSRCLECDVGAVRDSSANDSRRRAADYACAVSTSAERREELTSVFREARGCTRCPELARTRNQVVFGAGNADADLMFVGEAPGAKEDELGIPFVGAAGKLLDELLGEVGLARWTSSSRTS